MEELKEINYKNYYICKLEHEPFFTVQYLSDELIFNTLEEARKFIDNLEG